MNRDWTDVLWWRGGCWGGETLVCFVFSLLFYFLEGGGSPMILLDRKQASRDLLISSCCHRRAHAPDAIVSFLLSDGRMQERAAPRRRDCSESADIQMFSRSSSCGGVLFLLFVKRFLSLRLRKFFLFLSFMIK